MAAKDAVFVDGVRCVQCNIQVWLGVALLEMRQQLDLLQSPVSTGAPMPHWGAPTCRLSSRAVGNASGCH